MRNYIRDIRSITDAADTTSHIGTAVVKEFFMDGMDSVFGCVLRSGRCAMGNTVYFFDQQGRLLRRMPTTIKSVQFNREKMMQVQHMQKVPDRNNEFVFVVYGIQPENAFFVTFHVF